MKNLVNNIENKKMVKTYGITEAFFIDNEFYITSEFDLSFEMISEIENQLKS